MELSLEDVELIVVRDIGVMKQVHIETVFHLLTDDQNTTTAGN